MYSPPKHTYNYPLPPTHAHLRVLSSAFLPGHEDVEEAKVEQMHLPLPTTLHHITHILFSDQERRRGEGKREDRGRIEV